MKDDNPLDGGLTSQPIDLNKYADIKRFPLNDVGNALILADAFGPHLRFVHASSGNGGSWYVWDGTRWKRANAGEITRFAISVGVMRKQSLDYLSSEQRAALAAQTPTIAAMFRFVNSSMNIQAVQAMITLASSLAPMTLPAKSFDRDPWILGVKNGVVDLRTGTMRPAKPEDHVSIQAGVSYDQAATCPRWLQFLDEVFLCDGEVIDLVQRAVGSSLVGLPGFHLFFCEGTGRNGKSVFFRVIEAMLGDYSAHTQMTTFMPHGADAIRNDLARLFDMRFIGAMEQAPGFRLDEGIIKQLTGGDPLVARKLYQEHEQQVPSFKIWIGANHPPVIKDDTRSIRERLVRIPFNAYFPPSKADTQLDEKLLGELPGILNWALQGLSKWIADGQKLTVAPRFLCLLKTSPGGQIDDFLRECCERRDGATAGASQLFVSYLWHAVIDGTVAPVTQTAFGRRLRALGVEKAKDPHTRRVVYRGIGIVTNETVETVETVFGR